MIGVFTRNSASQLVMDGTWLEEDTGRSADIRAFSTASQALEPTPVPDDEEEENGQNQNPPTP